MRKISLLGIFIFIFAALTLTVSAESFFDVADDHPNADAIEYVKDEGIVSGYPDGSFKPDDPINRAEFTKIIIGSHYGMDDIDECYPGGLPVEDPPEDRGLAVFFPDVSITDWFSKYVCVAHGDNIVDGYPDGTFKPANNINFAEASKIIVNTFGYSVGTDDIWYKPYVDKLGEMAAIPTTINAFDKNITRGEMAEMIYRLKEEITTKDHLTYDSIEYGIGTNEEDIATYSEEGYSFDYLVTWEKTVLTADDFEGQIISDDYSILSKVAFELPETAGSSIPNKIEVYELQVTDLDGYLENLGKAPSEALNETSRDGHTEYYYNGSGEYSFISHIFHAYDNVYVEFITPDYNNNGVYLNWVLDSLEFE